MSLACISLTVLAAFLLFLALAATGRFGIQVVGFVAGDRKSLWYADAYIIAILWALFFLANALR